MTQKVPYAPLKATFVPLMLEEKSLACEVFKEGRRGVYNACLFFGRG